MKVKVNDENSQVKNKDSKLSKKQRVLRKRCRRFKSEIHKEYPGAYVTSNGKGEFYIVDAFGIRILQEENRVNSPSVYKAWKQTAIALHCCLEIQRNSIKFSDEAVTLKMMKKLTAGDLMG